MKKRACSEKYLSLARAITGLPKRNTWMVYDVKDDLLYINFYNPPLRADWAKSNHIDDDIVTFYQSNNIVGLQIEKIRQSPTIRDKCYLSLANAIADLPKTNIWMFYEAETDILYINFYDPPLKATNSELTDIDDILYRYQGSEMIGLTILNVSQR